MDITIIHIDTQNIKSNISHSLYKSKNINIVFVICFCDFYFLLLCEVK